MIPAFDRPLRRLDWAPLLALGLLVAASVVLVLQQWLYHHERQQHLDRERTCRECPSPATE
ncbi:hypothetical protein [Nannocystis radixulma]|uniref:Uncharacterized protein n=1 Tax=Nannocystis radixulma TaxID=2995305 RepID=A0ABT5B562_9BACT|nr:hypothetical protein [Nannocystis radixulma]MDC0669259.1 hypothetical protein [Nannocystis radixulma]